MSEIEDNFQIVEIKKSHRQMKKLENEMKKWYKKKEDELIKLGKNDMKIETTEFTSAISSIINEDLDIQNDVNYSNLKI